MLRGASRAFEANFLVDRLQQFMDRRVRARPQDPSARVFREQELRQAAGPQVEVKDWDKAGGGESGTLCSTVPSTFCGRSIRYVR